jgi:hypothetical protein
MQSNMEEISSKSEEKKLKVITIFIKRPMFPPFIII